MTSTALFITKMNGSGNDFILIDHRIRRIDERCFPDVARSLCRRRECVGADGLILIENSTVADFKWRFFNADGTEAEMCGNGGRCAARYALLKGIAGSRPSFETIAGIIHAQVKGRRVVLDLPLPTLAVCDRVVWVGDTSYRLGTINTGVPHAVLMVTDITQAPVVELGRKIRLHQDFLPAGTNVNFVQILDRGHLAVRTYERGVEDETLACGTGSVASALVAAAAGLVASPVEVRTRGGEVLVVAFQTNEDGSYAQVSLEGDTCLVFEGTVGEDIMAQLWLGTGQNAL